jgi:hypothetical protein
MNVTPCSIGDCPWRRQAGTGVKPDGQSKGVGLLDDLAHGALLVSFR